MTGFLLLVEKLYEKIIIHQRYLKDLLTNKVLLKNYSNTFKKQFLRFRSYLWLLKNEPLIGKDN